MPLAFALLTFLRLALRVALTHPHGHLHGVAPPRAPAVVVAPVRVAARQWIELWAVHQRRRGRTMDGVDHAPWTEEDEVVAVPEPARGVLIDAPDQAPGVVQEQLLRRALRPPAEALPCRVSPKAVDKGVVDEASFEARLHVRVELLRVRRRQVPAQVVGDACAVALEVLLGRGADERRRIGVLAAHTLAQRLVDHMEEHALVPVDRIVDVAGEVAAVGPARLLLPRVLQSTELFLLIGKEGPRHGLSVVPSEALEDVADNDLLDDAPSDVFAHAAEVAYGV